MYQELKISECLGHSKNDLNLGRIYLKHIDTSAIPNLMTIYEIHKPIEVAHKEIDSIISELKKKHSSGYCLKGMFTLGISHFETFLLQLCYKYLQFHPEKLDLISKKQSNDEGITVIEGSYKSARKYISYENLIELEIYKLGYKNITIIIEKLSKLFELDFNISTETIDRLIEIKETRNLLVHNNLVVNDFYLEKTKTFKRSTKKHETLALDEKYVSNSLTLVKTFIENIQSKIVNKYGNFTLINLLKKAWSFTFTNTTFVTIEKFCTLNEENDTIDGPFHISSDYSSSETMYMEFWRAQRTGMKMESSFSMVHLMSGHKLSFLADLFGELRMTHW